MVEHGNSIADIVFQRTRSNQLVAEIAFAPALAFVVVNTTSAGVQGAILFWIMTALIVIPILRYLVFTDRAGQFDLILSLTVRPVELFSILGVVQIFKFFGIEFFQPVSGFNEIEATAVVTFIFTIIYILFFELIFKKYRFSWGTLFYVKRLSLENKIDIQMDDIEEVSEAISQNKSQWVQLWAALSYLKLTLIRITFGQVAFHLLKESIPDRDDEVVEELKKYVEINRDENKLANYGGLWLAFGITAFVTLLLLGTIAGLISIFLATFGGVFLVLVIMRLTKHMVAFSLIAFGTMDYEQFVTSNREWFAMTTLYTLSVYLLIFHPF